MHRRSLLILTEENMTEQNNVLSQEEMDFKAWHKAAWEEVEQFYEMVKSGQNSFGENDPQHRLAAEAFQMYLEKRPSEIATKALNNAFTMWGNLEGVSDQVQAALKHIFLIPKMCGDEVEHGLREKFSDVDWPRKRSNSPIGGIGRKGRSFEESIDLTVRFSRYLGTRR